MVAAEPAAAGVTKVPEDGPLEVGGDVPGVESGAMDMEVEASGQEEGQAMQE